MTEYYLRIEGVNLGNFIYDTADLNTIRGASLSLLDTIENVPNMVEGMVELKAISTGASSGLFSFTAPDGETDIAEKVKEKIRDAIADEPVRRNATFVLDIIPSSGEKRFAIDRERLISMNRWNQMQQPRLAIPERNKKKSINVCGIDRVRPGIEYDSGEKIPVSTSVQERRKFGRGQKKGNFYKNYATGVKPSRGFTQHFDELTLDPKKGNLNHKMAVIYLDGNSFGKIQSRCKSPEKLNEFDRTIKSYRADLLGGIITLMDSDPANWVSNEGNYRFETLVWGGDEMILSVPAWQGWNLLTYIYEQMRRWEFIEETDEGIIKKRLTHAGGLVFCHHNAPINRVTYLAHRLAENAKAESREANLFSYQVLESFDHVGVDMERLRSYYRSPDEDNSYLILRGTGMRDVIRAFDYLKGSSSGFPRRKLYELLDMIRDIPPEAANELEAVIDDAIDSLNTIMGKDTEKLLSVYFRDNYTLWFHLAELWDYIGKQV